MNHQDASPAEGPLPVGPSAEGRDGGNPFTDEVIAAVSAHMNEDHRDDSLVICRGLGERPDATGARMVGMDGYGIDFAVMSTGDAEEVVRIPFSRPLRERAEVRTEVVEMHRAACERLGLELPSRS